MRYYLDLPAAPLHKRQDRMWVDAAGETIHVVNEGDPLALPFAP